jgi:hypothetical protein
MLAEEVVFLDGWKSYRDFWCTAEAGRGGVSC